MRPTSPEPARPLRSILSALTLSVALASLWLPSAGMAQGPFEVTDASLRELQMALTAGRTTSVGLVEAYLARIAAYDDQGPALNALLALNPAAREQAAALDAERRRSGPRRNLRRLRSRPPQPRPPGQRSPPAAPPP